MTKTTPALTITLSLLLAACSDGTGETGGGGGDGDPNAAADAAILEPFAGLYDLTGNWRGDEGDVAYLAIREPDDSGRSVVVLSDVDEVDNCSDRPRNGELRVDRLTSTPQVFLNDLADLEAATLRRDANGALQIEISDQFDIDNDGIRSERVVVSAQLIAATEQDIIPPSCR